jgi:GDP-4-dehydro-6-deoxy-D-mannose reductase
VRALVTGAAGFAGRHLVDALRSAGHEVHGADLHLREPGPGGHASADGVVHHRLDVTDAAACRAVVGATRPDVLFHLAGFAHVGKAEQAADACLGVNFGGTRAVLEACLAASSSTRVLLVSSAEVYGRVQDSELPVTEEAPLRPSTIYAVSKAAAEMAGHHARARGLSVLLLRPFNHVGPGQSPDFMAAAFAQQVARIEGGLQEPVLRVGNLEARRDLLDVRDTVAGYVLAAVAGRPDATYNVCSGRAVAVRDVLDTLLALSRVPIRVEQDPARLRALDMPVFLGSGARLARDTGFQPRRALRDTLADVLDYFRASAAVECERR